MGARRLHLGDVAVSAASFHGTPTPDRGIDYADGGIANLDVHYPDPERIAAIHAEWAEAEGEG